jgi:hypothetical protein
MSETEDLLRLVRASIEPWNAWDVDGILGSAFFGGGADGFGFRTRDARVDVPVDLQRQILTAWFASLDRYRIEDLEVQCRIDDGIATLWGFFTEDFRHEGGEAERLRVRFSNVLRRRDGTWESVWNHRDVQEFSDDGTYIARPVT